MSAWTIVASRVVSQSTVENLALGASSVISDLAIVDLTTHAGPRAARAVKDVSPEREGQLAAPAQGIVTHGTDHRNQTERATSR